MEPSERFTDALAYAERLHRCQKRKGRSTPYVAHLLAVCSLVLEWGGDEDVAIAALLHDAVEDQGGLETLSDIEQRFGPTVAALVLECSDNQGPDSTAAKQAWLERKRVYLESIKSKSRGAALITSADKLHNARSIVADLEQEGARTLDRFSDPDRVPWYYEEVLRALADRPEPPPVSELRAVVTRLKVLAARPVEASA
jgi:(p)ppGpp synthase/HD superfamily hydrolase